MRAVSSHFDGSGVVRLNDRFIMVRKIRRSGVIMEKMGNPSNAILPICRAGAGLCPGTRTAWQAPGDRSWRFYATGQLFFA